MNPRVSGSPATGGGHCHPANATSRPLTLARPAASGKNSAEHAFRKRLQRQLFWPVAEEAIGPSRCRGSGFWVLRTPEVALL